MSPYKATGAVLLVWLASPASLMAEPSPTPGGLLQRSHSMRLEIRNGYVRFSGLRPGQRATVTLRCAEGLANESLIVSHASADAASLTYAYHDAQQQWSVEVQRLGQVLIRRRTKRKDDHAQKDEHLQVEYRQPHSGSVSLVVHDGVSTRTLTAPDFWRLMLLDGPLCREHLIPMLQTLRPGWRLNDFAEQIEQALLARSATARLLDQQMVNGLVHDLGHPEFRRRQSAERRLRRMGHQAAGHLGHVDRSDLSAEQRYRLRQISRALHVPDRDTPERVAAWLIGDPGTWVALLDREDIQRRQVAAAHLERLLDRPLNFDALADESERTQQLARLRSEFGLTPPTLISDRADQPRQF